MFTTIRLALIGLLLLVAVPAAAQNINNAAGRVDQVSPAADAGVARMGCRYTTSPTAVTDGDDQQVRCDQNGAVQTTPGTGSVQDVNLVKTNGITQSTGTGPVGTGTERIAVGTDTATIAGSAPGTAGTASAQVVTVQGVASMTPVQTTGTGTAGSAATGVSTIQGIASMIAVKTDGSGVTQPVSGTVTANNSTAANLRIAGGDAAGSPAAGTVLAVQGIGGGTAVPVSGTVTAISGTAANFLATTIDAGDVASAATDSGNPIKVGGKALDSMPTAVTANQRVNAWFGLGGQLHTMLAYPSYAYISAGIGDTQVKSGAGVLHALIINQVGSGGNTVQLFDNTSCATTSITGTAITSAAGTRFYDLRFATGLCVKSATGSGADMTVVYE